MQKKVKQHVKVQSSAREGVNVSALSQDCAVLRSTVYECDLFICLCVFVPGAV